MGGVSDSANISNTSCDINTFLLRSDKLMRKVRAY